MQNKQVIEHVGIVSEITNNLITAKIITTSACGGCHANGSCGMSEAKEKEININRTDKSIKVGDKINIVLQKSLGFKAVFYAYVLPLFVFILGLALFIKIFNNELKGAFFAFALLALYYGSLYFFRNSFEKKFIFTLKSNM